jgi:hypothetical protein
VARRHPLQWLFDLWDRFQRWMATLTDAHPALTDVFLAIAVVLLAILLTHIGYTVWQIYGASRRPDADRPVMPGGIALVDARAHLRRAEALAREGRYAEALAHRFAAVILDLEGARALTVDPAKTPAEYAAEARLDPTGRETLSTLVARLYRHLFGAVPIDADGYREFGDDARLVLDHVAAR